MGLDGCEVRLCDPCARLCPCVLCAPCVSRLPPVSFYRYRWGFKKIVHQIFAWRIVALWLRKNLRKMRKILSRRARARACRIGALVRSRRQDDQRRARWDVHPHYHPQAHPDCARQSYGGTGSRSPDQQVTLEGLDQHSMMVQASIVATSAPRSSTSEPSGTDASDRVQNSDSLCGLCR